MAGKVSIYTTIKPIMEGGKARTYQLIFKVTDPSGYPDTIAERRPEACFVYSRTKPSEPLENPYERICSLDDFMTIPYATETSGEREGLYRSNQFHMEYADYNSSLQDQTLLESLVWAFYNNLDNYTLPYSGKEASRKYTFPDYERSLLDSLIAERRKLILENEEERLIIEVIQEKILPLISSQELMQEELQEAADLLFEHTKKWADAVINMAAVRDAMMNLRGNMHILNTQLANNMATFTNSFSQLNGLNTDVNNSSASDTDKLNLSKNINIIRNIVNPAMHEDLMVDTATMRGLIRTMLPALAHIQEVDEEGFTDYAAVENMINIIKKFGDTLKSTLAKKEAEINMRSENIQRRQKKIQDIETELRKIRPSIDLNNPESAWYLTVNVGG